MIDMGWVSFAPNRVDNSTDFPNRSYSYSGSPVRYGVTYNGTAEFLRPPQDAVAAWAITKQGCVATPIKRDGLSVFVTCLLYTSPSPRDVEESRMPSSA